MFIFAFLFSCVIGADIFQTEGHDFEDTFTRFENTQWRKDRGTRHCMEGQCFFASRDNIEYVAHTRDVKNPYAKSEVVISLRNDCFEDYCCRNEKECTQHTSGQLTSQQTYGYGHFYFLLRISKQAEGK